MTPSAAVTSPLVVLDRATIARSGGPVVLRDFSWTIREGETWAVVGPVGCGKTTLAETLLGRHPMRAGSIAWPVVDRVRATGRPAASAADVVRHVAFKEDSRLFTYAGHYYQQRFEFADADEPLTLAEYLRSGSGASSEAIRGAADRLGLGDRLAVSFIKLSNGQARRARIARALLLHPDLLILDDPYLGVDAAGRADLTALLGGLVRDGLRLVLICPEPAVPAWVTGIIRCGGESEAGRRTDARHKAASDSLLARTHHSRVVPPVGAAVVELRDVTIAHGGRTILDRVSWTVRAGERWAVTGPNGSGKTTLLSLLCGDHPQAYANAVRLFGRQRGSGESIWEVKQRVGLVSPEFHLYFTQPLTAERTAATGFFDTLTDRPTTPEQDATVSGLFEAFGIAHLAQRRFAQLSTGEQRLGLLVRALVKRPPLLILDEPFQGLDPDTAERIRTWLDAHLGTDQTLLFVSHHEEELPHTTTHRLRLAVGRVVEAG